MSKQVISASQIKEIVNKIQYHHSTSYTQIADHVKSFDVEKEEWPVNEVVNTLNGSLDSFEKKSELLNNKIMRKETKIFLFGNVSVGKSKVINSLLKLDLFVSASSHTTSCFVHIMKSQDSKYIIKYNNKEESFEDIGKLRERMEKLGTTHDKENKEKLNIDELIEFHLPIKDHKILKEGTHIIDCPGAGNQESITNAIDKHSEDADIFIFVMSNAVTDADKQFFKQQSKLSCKPDVFILVNRWDDTDQDDETATKNSKLSIIQECSDFLTDECDMQDSKISDRFFFISAKEIFQLQVKRDKNEIKMNDKVKQRCENFERFEKKLEQYIANPQQSKTRRYKKEKDIIEKDINQKCVDSRRQILDLKKSSSDLHYDNITESLTELKKSLKKEFVDFKLKLKTKIDSDIDKIAEHKDVLNEDLVQSKISLLNKELEEKMKSFTKDEEKTIVNFLKENLKQSNETKTKIKSKKTSKVSEKVDLHINKSNDAEESGIFSGIAKSLSMVAIPVGGLAVAVGAATGLALVGGAAVLLNKYLQSETRKKEAKTQLEKIKIEILNNCGESLENTKKHYDKTIKSLAESMKKQKELIDGYWKEMERILAPWQNLDKN